MSKNTKKVCIIGCFAKGKNLLNGQTVKTKIVAKELVRVFGKQNIGIFDTYGGTKEITKFPVQCIQALKSSQNVIIMPAENGLRVISPFIVAINCMYHRKLHYIVIGGWLPEFLKDKPVLAYLLKKFDAIYVETQSMMTSLENQGFNNIIVMPNCKELNILKKDMIKTKIAIPYKLCTFSRVMKEKGIEEAVMAVKCVNEKYGKTIFNLDIYGQIEDSQQLWFEQLKRHFPEYIKYGGVIPFDKSTNVLKNYYALLFPTYYDGEGVAGTLIDGFAAGIPVIASDWKYNSEIVRNNVTGKLVVPKNIDDLCVKLDKIYLDKAFWLSLKGNCIDEARKYTVKNVMKILISEIDK